MYSVKGRRLPPLSAAIAAVTFRAVTGCGSGASAAETDGGGLPASLDGATSAAPTDSAEILDGPSVDSSSDATFDATDGGRTLGPPAVLPDAECGPGLISDAAPRTCAFTPADVACDSDSDCTVYQVVGCGCFDPVVGVNASSTAQCLPPPCPPPMPNPCSPYGSGLTTQTCENVSQLSDVAVACVQHVCVTYAASTPRRTSTTAAAATTTAGRGWVTRTRRALRAPAGSAATPATPRVAGRAWT